MATNFNVRPLTATLGLLSLMLAPQAIAKQAVKRPASPMDALRSAVVQNDLKRFSSLSEACEKSNFRRLATALRGANRQLAREKTEYETAEDFAAYVLQVENAVNGDAQIVVCQPLTNELYSSFRYDPERSVFKASLQPSVNIYLDRSNEGGYVGQNAFGVRRNVRRVREVDYRLSMTFSRPYTPAFICAKWGRKSDCKSIYREVDDSKLRCFYRQFQDCEFEVPFPKETAAKLRETGYMAYVGKLKFPFLVDFEVPWSATISRPVEKRDVVLSVKMVPSQIYVVGLGSEIAKVDINDGYSKFQEAVIAAESKN